MKLTETALQTKTALVGMTPDWAKDILMTAVGVASGLALWQWAKRYIKA